MKLSYLDLMTTDPSYNLAMEQYVFDCLPRDRMYFMLWQNDNAIIVGKYQNTIAEINEETVRERGIRVVRRLSGGGAVYHDMGNLNFTFITDVGESNALDLKLFCEPVVRTLATLGVTVLAVLRDFSGGLPYLVSLIGVYNVATGYVLGKYFDKSRAENTVGGIVYETALQGVKRDA